MKKPSPPSLTFIDPFLEKVGKLSRLQRIMICVVTLALIIAPTVYFVYIPKHEKIETLEREYESLSAELAQYRKKARSLNKYRAEVKAVEAEFNKARQALPESEEIPSLLKNISHAGQDSGLEFLHFRPERERPLGFYAEIPVSMRFRGGYHEVLDFFYRVSKMSRIVNIIDIKMNATKDRKRKGDSDMEQLDVSCTSVTYKFVDRPPQPSTQKKKK